jgi:hypothetical protein
VQKDCRESINSSIVYTYYQPTTHEEVKDYIAYVLHSTNTYNKETRQIATNSLLRKKVMLLQDCIGQQRRSLVFDSNFECGNLERVVKRTEVEYDLYVNSDTNNKNRRQWFYFSVLNMNKDVIKFNVMNLTKYSHFIKEGMKPLVFSEYDKHLGWTNNTYQVEMRKDGNGEVLSKGERTIRLEVGEEDNEEETTNNFILSFTYKFKHEKDKVCFAFWEPYSYTCLQLFLQENEALLLQEARKLNADIQLNSEILRTGIETPSIYYKHEQLCLTLGQVPVDLITITSKLKYSDKSTKSYVIVTARAHAGETAGSYKAEGFIQFLLSDDAIAVGLREEHIFIVIPMLNPDGVILGNSRYSLAGCDINRCWKNPRYDSQPVIFHLKQRISTIISNGDQIALYCDLHGHSKAFNSFLFACNTSIARDVVAWTKLRLFPRLLAKRSNVLKYSQCRFGVQRDKVN